MVIRFAKIELGNRAVAHYSAVAENNQKIENAFFIEMLNRRRRRAPSLGSGDNLRTIRTNWNKDWLGETKGQR